MVQAGDFYDNIIGPPGPQMHRHRLGPGNEALVHAGDYCNNINKG